MPEAAHRRLAVVTGASSGIGFELARQFAEHGFDLVIAAEDGAVKEAAGRLRAGGGSVTAVRVDLATFDGVEELLGAIEARGAVDALALNAGVGVGGAFIETDLRAHLDLIALNITGLVHLAHRLLPAMVERASGRVLFTSSVAAQMPGPYYATYAASKSFVQSFSQALRRELKDSGVTITALLPGPTDTDFFERAGIEDSKAGRGPKDDPADVAKDGFDALMAGEAHVVVGSFKAKAQAIAGKLLPDRAGAAMQGSMVEPPTEPG